MEAFVAAGALKEHHWAEAKKALGPSGKDETNIELGRDLASLSVEGGTLFIGVTDGKGKGDKLVGIADVEAERDRLDQISRTRVSPPLNITTTTFADPDDPALAVLIVTVPASASAPHMVDGKYWGRCDTGKQALTDTQVRQLLAAREQRSSRFGERLDAVAQVLNEPQAAERKTSRYFLRAEPIASNYPPPSVADSITEPVPFQLWQRLGVAGMGIHQPGLRHADQPRPHSDGWAATTDRPASPVPDPDHVRLTALITDDGSWLISSGGATRPLEDNPSTPGPTILYTRHLLELAHVVCVAIGALSRTTAPYSGEWIIGVHIDHLEGIEPFENHSPRASLAGSFSAYRNSTYRQIVTTTTQELAETPQMVVEQLFARLLRAIGMAGCYLPYTSLEDKISKR
ncbi:AlbA family DNA-binding domain-containing protein [Nocardia asiatica]|uniref:AlbA family DNA-binding domain-containing protein n=1 Tax=Nocardia asiatica TaxID=209252 RepID=UPI0024549473|nr:ATP-binding protein [Nocardia asiatica]